MMPLARGFLPEIDPLDLLPEACSAWQECANELPKLLVSDLFHNRLLQLPTFAVSCLKTERELERAMQILSYLGHAYVWTMKKPPQTLPEILARPWYEIGQKLNRPPVLSYASYALHNWKRLDPNRPIELGNIVLIQNFLGGVDEEWFILVHVDIEAKAASGLNAAFEAIKAAKSGNCDALTVSLKQVQQSLEQMCKTLLRMPEKCDPYIYYHRVRPYIHGWKNHPSFPNGLIYEGVYDNKPQQFRGETGAQSTIIPTFDALFGITHSPDELYHYLQQMRNYMPESHRAFLHFVETNSVVRAFIRDHQTPKLKELYNSCILLLDRFRKIHLGYAASYIQKQHQMSEGNPNAVGTGGTPFMQYLQKHEQETTAFLL